LKEYDPLAEKLLWSWSATPPTAFYSHPLGGVQLLSSGNLLFNDLTRSPVAKEIKRDGTLVWEMPNIARNWNGKVAPFQQIKRMDLSRFLSKNQAP
jgi:hypothetical protein